MTEVEAVDCGSSLQMAATRLADGDAVRLRPVGGSMTPRIRSRQLVELVPVRTGDAAWLRTGDVVLVRMGEHGRLYLHLILQLREGRVKIGSARGSVNGWTRVENIFGKVVRIL